MPITPGTRLGSYEITSLLGSGGMGQVYRAKDLKLGRDVAIKVLREELAADPERLRRFEQEARSASALNHPNIVTIYDIGKHGDTPYIAMEYVEGRTLREMLAEGPLPTKKLLQLATQIAEGLAKAHAAGIIHRDLKPENLMVSSDGYVKILDFGLAKLRTHIAEASEAQTVTKEGVVLGTVGYMSPEQAKGQEAGFRSDQFSFGAVLYEMATGSRAFKRDTFGETIANIIRDEPQPIDQLNPVLPVHLRKVIERCLAKNLEDRYDSTRDLARELGSVELAPQSQITERSKELRSIVVLPLANLSADPEQEYFSDGMTEALITDLAKIGSLKVISRTSAMHYKKTDKTLPEIARELKVDTVVEGSVLRAGNRVRITAQLIHAGTDEHLWAESYERQLEDILSLQSDVARAIAGEVRARLTPEERARLTGARSVNPKAHEAHLKGLYHWNKFSAEGLKKAIEHYQTAIDTDPSYAPAYAGLAMTHGASTFYGFAATSDVAHKGIAAALKAVELDENLAEAQSALGGLKLYFEWDWGPAEAAIKKALKLNPGFAEAHQIHAHYLMISRCPVDSVREIKLARELDPLSPIVNSDLGLLLHIAKHYDEAIDQLEKTLELVPNFLPAHLLLGSTYDVLGKHEEALVELKKVYELMGRSDVLEAMNEGYKIEGFKGAFASGAKQMEEKFKERYTSPYFVASRFASADDFDKAMEWLEKAYEERNTIMVYLNVFPKWDKWRSEPRFQDLIRRMNFPN